MPSADRQPAFEAALSNEVYAAAWGYACRLCAPGGTGARADAEDLLQEALIRAYQRFAQLREAAKFKGWLLCIMRRCFLDRHRRAGRRIGELGLEAYELAAPEADATPYAGPVRLALGRLPGAQRELLTLFYVEGLSLEETGQVTGLSARVVRQRLYRAREGLRRALAECGMPHPQDTVAPCQQKG